MGDVGAIAESIQANGFYGALVVQRSSGHVIAGNHRLAAARAVGIGKVPVIYLDVDDDRALRILLADNRTNDLASYDDHVLTNLLADLMATHDKLAGTGYDTDTLDQLLKDLTGPATFDDNETPKPLTCPQCGHQWSRGP